MKKLSTIAKLAALLLCAALLFSCANDSSSSSSTPDTPDEVKKYTKLSERLKNAKDGDVIDITKEGLTIDADTFTVSKSVTIQNGDLNGAQFIVQEDEAADDRSLVGDFISFILSNLFNTQLTVNSPASVNMQGTKVKNMRVDSNAAEVSLSGSSKVEELAVNSQDLTLSAEDTSSNVAILSASENSEKIELGGKANITTLLAAGDTKVSTASGSAVTIEASDLEVSGASVAAKFATASADEAFYCSNNDMQPISADADGVYTHTIPMSDEVWSEWINVYLGITDSEGGENYKIVFDVKTDVDAILPLKVRTNYSDGNERVLHTIADTWYPVTIYTGKYPKATERYVLELPADNPDSDVTISLKNIRYCKASDTDENAPAFPSSGYYMMRDKGSVTVSHDGIATVEFKESKQNLWEQGANILPDHLFYGAWNKITYKLKLKNPSANFSFSTSPRVQDVFWKNGNYTEEGDTWGMNWSYAEAGAIPADTEVTAVAYIHALKGYCTSPYDEKDADVEPFIKVYISDTTKNVITFTDFNVETIAALPDEFVPMWDQEYVNDVNSYSVSEITEDFCFMVPANGSYGGKAFYTTTPDDPWGTRPKSNNTVTSNINYVIWDGELPEGIIITNYKDDDPLSNKVSLIKFENDTNENIYLSVRITEKGLNFEVENNPVIDDSKAYFIPTGEDSGVVTLADPDKTEGNWSDAVIGHIDATANTLYSISATASATVLKESSNKYMQLFAIPDGESEPIAFVQIPDDGSEVKLSANFKMTDTAKPVWILIGGHCKAEINYSNLVIKELEDGFISRYTPDETDENSGIVEISELSTGWTETLLGTFQGKANTFYRVTGTVKAEVTPITNDWVDFRIVQDNSTDLLVQTRISSDGQTVEINSTFQVGAEDVTLYKKIGTNCKGTITVSNIQIEETTPLTELDALWYVDIPKDYYTDSVNIIFNGNNGSQTDGILISLAEETTSYGYDWWTIDEAGKYTVTELKEGDIPTEIPAKGYIRFYWHAKFLENITPHFYSWFGESDSFKEYKKWPGVPMTKYSEVTSGD